MLPPYPYFAVTTLYSEEERAFMGARGRLFDAIKTGNLADIRDIHARYPESLEWQNDKKHTPLFWAIKHDKIETLKLLIDLGANIERHLGKDVEIRMPGVFSKVNNVYPLEFAIDKNNSPHVKLLLERGARISHGDTYDALDLARKKNLPYIIHLIETGGKIRADYLARKSSPESVPQTAPSAGESIDAPKKFSLRALFGGTTKLARDRTWEEDRAVFFGAVYKNDVATIAKIAQKYGTESFSWQNDKGQTALHLAIEKNKLRSLIQLIRSGSDPNTAIIVQDPRYDMLKVPIKVSVLEYAAGKNKEDIVYCLLQHGAYRTSGQISPGSGKVSDMIKRRQKIRAEFLSQLKENPVENLPDPAPLPELAVKDKHREKQAMDALERRVEALSMQLDRALRRIEELEKPQIVVLPKGTPGAHKKSAL